MKFQIALISLAFVIVLSLISLIVVIIIYSGEGDCEATVFETRYQCNDGRFVSSIDKCPVITAQVTTTVYTPPREEEKPASYTTTTSTLCPCTPGLTTIFSTSTTMWKGAPCDNDFDCGAISYGDIKCINGDEHLLVNSPICNKGYCITRISSEFRKACTSSQTCRNDIGCVARSD